MNFLSDQNFYDTLYKAFCLYQSRTVAPISQFSFATLFLISDAKKTTRTYVKILKNVEKKVVDSATLFI
jgi:hypothetical protein